MCSNLFDKDGIADVLDLDLVVVEAVCVAAVCEYIAIVDAPYLDAGVVEAADVVFLDSSAVGVADTIPRDYIVVVPVVVDDIFVDDKTAADEYIVVFDDVSIGDHVLVEEYISVLVDAVLVDMAVDKSVDVDSSADHYSRSMNDEDDFHFLHDAQDLVEELNGDL